RLRLQAPVLALSLRVDTLLPFEEHSQSLVPDARSRALGWSQLVDKLKLRLGSERLCRLAVRDDHRPEHSWQRCAPGPARLPQQPGLREATAAARQAPRPLWLLDP